MKRQSVALSLVVAFTLASAPAQARIYYEASIGCPSTNSAPGRARFAAKDDDHAMSIAVSIVQNNVAYLRQNCVVLAVVRT